MWGTTTGVRSADLITLVLSEGSVDRLAQDLGGEPELVARPIACSSMAAAWALDA